MVEKFHNELNQLKKEVLKMGYLSRDMLKKSIEAFKDLDREKAEWVISKKIKLADIDDNTAYYVISAYG